MSNIVGSKLKLLNAVDIAAADSLATMYTVELALTTSRLKKIKCGAIVIFKLNDIPELDFKENADPLEAFEMKKELNEMTDRMYRDPEYFKESDGRWLRYALTRVLEIFDELGTYADIIVKSPRLRIRHKIKRKDVLKLRNNPKELFRIAFDIDILLSGDYKYDPWRSIIRRGDIGAKK